MTERSVEELQETLERNRGVVQAEHPAEGCLTSVSSSVIEYRQESVPCRECRTEIHGVAVPYRVEPDPENPGKTRDVRMPNLPVMCDRCVEADEVAHGLPVSVPPSIEDWLKGLGVNTRKHGHATLENFDPTDSPKALKATQRFVADVIAAGQHDRVQGLYFFGQDDGEHTGNGTGKSHLAVAIMRAVHEARPDLRIIFEPADRLVSRVQDSYGSGDTDQLITLRAKADLYVLDDLGREKGTADALRVLCTILDEREGAPTVITSNALPRDLGARYDDEMNWMRVASRLGDEVYRYVAVGGEDRRFARSPSLNGSKL